MNQYLTHTELENLHYLIGEHQKIANQLEVLAQTSANPKIKSNLKIAAESAKAAHNQMLSSFR